MAILKQKLLVVLLAFILLNVTELYAGDYDIILEEAEAAYSEGFFGDAIQLYDSIIASGFESSELYYNLGNAYYKSNDIPNAILFYERAGRLAPSDEDILTNLNIARNKTIDKIEEVPVAFYVRWWIRVAEAFSSNTWSVLSIAFSLLFFAFLSLFLFVRRIPIKRVSFWAGLLFLVLSIHCLLFANRAHQKINKSKEAIVFTPTVAIKSSPDDNSTDLFVIHEGTKVKITDEVGEWKEIKIASGSVGWLKSVTVVMI